MSKSTVVVYTGARARGFVLKKPRLTHFEPFVPRAVDDRLVQYLPRLEFAAYNPDEAYSAGRPLLVVLPNNTHELVPALHCVAELKQHYPSKQIDLILHDSELHWIVPLVIDMERVTLAAFYRAEMGKYLQELTFKISPTDPLAKATKTRTLESVYGEHTKTIKPNPAKPTLIHKSTGKKPPCLIPPLGMGDKWDALIAAMCETMPELQVMDIALTLEEQYKQCKNAAFVICVGNPHLTTVLAYSGVRLFEFIDEPVNMRLHQMQFFRNVRANAVQYAQLPRTTPPEKVAATLRQLLIDGVDNGVESRPPVEIPTTPVKEVKRGSRYRPSNRTA